MMSGKPDLGARAASGVTHASWRGKKSQGNSRSSDKVGSKMEVSERGSDPFSLPPRGRGTAQGREGSNSRRTGRVGSLAR